MPVAEGVWPIILTSRGGGSMAGRGHLGMGGGGPEETYTTRQKRGIDVVCG